MLLQFCKNLLLRIQLTYNTFNNANRWPFLLLLGVGVSRRGEVVGELIYLPTRARIYNNVPPSKLMFYNILINQPFTKLFQKSFEKKTDMFGVNRYIGYFCTR